MILSLKQSPWNWIAIAILSQATFSTTALAQVKTDTTSNTKVIRTTPSHTLIEGGRRVNGNLFHSFQDFSIAKKADTVQFVLPSGGSVTSIFARVTGKSRSRINGTLASDGQANLFFMNPNGIVFQKNARLKIGGSFFGTTGAAIRFANGQTFSAIAPQNTQLLTVKTPVGIQLGSTPGLIKNFAQAPNNKAGLKLKPNRDFVLLGGDIQFLGGKTSNPNGRVVLGAVGPNQRVGLNSIDLESPLDFEKVSRFRNIVLNDSAFIKTISKNFISEQNRNRAITIWGNHLNSKNKVRIRSNINQNLNINLTGTLRLSDRSKIVTDTTSKLGTGNLDIKASNLLLRGGSQINASVGNTAVGGNINLNIQDRILISDISPLSRESSAILSDGFQGGTGGEIRIQAPLIRLQSGGLIRSQVFNEGEGGQIQLMTDELTLRSGSQISSTAVLAQAFGNAGSITIDASKRISVTGSRRLSVSGRRRQTAIRAEALGLGRAGNVEINTPVLEVLDGAQISNTTRGTAGQNIFNISDRLLISGIPNNRSSGIFSDALENGQAGPIRINAPQIEVDEGGLIRSQVFADGIGGNISIDTDQLSIRNGSKLSSSATRLRGVGEPGDIKVTARDSITVSGSIIVPKTEVERLSSISAEARGNSTSGDIELMADQLNVLDGAQVSNTTSGNSLSSEGSGSINLTVNKLRLTGKAAEIVSETLGRSPAGNISIQAQQNTPLKLMIGNGNQISASSSDNTQGLSGKISLSSLQSVLVEGPGKIAAESLGESSGGLIQIQSPLIQVQKGATITSQSSGLSKAGDIVLDGDILVLRDRAFLTTSSDLSSGGNIQLNLQDAILLSGGSQITAEAQGKGQGNGGNIFSRLPVFVSPLLIALPNNNVEISANSLGQQGGNIDLGQFRVFGFDEISSQDTTDSSRRNQISASGRTPALDGTINAQLVTNFIPNSLPVPPVIAATSLKQQCNASTNASNRSTFRSIGAGGVATHRLDEGRTLWDDTRPMERVHNRPTTSLALNSSEPASASPLPLEAQGWHQMSGRIHLLASPLLPVTELGRTPSDCKTVIGAGPRD